MKKKKNPKEFKRSHQPRKSVSRYRRTSSVALKRRKPQENKALQIITKTLHLLLLFVISSLIIYLLFKSEKKTSPSEEPVAEEQQLAEAEIMEGDELTESETINSDTLPKA